MIEVSKHATKRIRERLGLPKKAAQSEAERAFEKGLRIDELCGRLRRFLDRKHLILRDGADYRITPAAIYVIKNDVLVTVMPVPEELRGLVMNAWKEKHGD